MCSILQHPCSTHVCLLHAQKRPLVRSVLTSDVQKDFVNWYQKMAELFPGGQPTGEAAALATSVKTGGKISPGIKPIFPSGSPNALRATKHDGSAPLITRTSSSSTVGGLRRTPPPPLPSVPEHGLASLFPDGSSSTQVLDLARSAAQVSVSKSPQNTLSGTAQVPDSRADRIPQAQAQLLGTSTFGISSQLNGSGSLSIHEAPAHDLETNTLGNGNSGVSQAAVPTTSAGVSKASAVGRGNRVNYPPAVLEAAKPYMTGDPSADQDILGFYMARHSMMQGGG